MFQWPLTEDGTVTPEVTLSPGNAKTSPKNPSVIPGCYCCGDPRSSGSLIEKQCCTYSEKLPFQKFPANMVAAIPKRLPDDPAVKRSLVMMIRRRLLFVVGNSTVT